MKKSEARFDYTSKVQTGTISELLSEINAEREPLNGEGVTFKSLKLTLAFIENITGSAIKNIDDPIPIPTLKVVKLLFSENEKCSLQLFRLLRRPEADKKPTMEFCTGTTIPRDEKAREGARIINVLTAAFAKDIAEDKIQLLKRMLGDEKSQSTAEKFQRYIERASLVAEEIFRKTLCEDNLRIATAFGELSSRIASMDLSSGNVGALPVQETLYIHLQTLALQHFILDHPKHLRKVLIKGKIGSIDESARQFCSKLSEIHKTYVTPEGEVVLLQTCDVLIREYAKEFKSLVKLATNCNTRKYRFSDNIRRAKAILASAVLRRPHDDRSDQLRLEEACVSVLEIVAALCSVRYEQEQKGSTYHSYSLGQGSKGESPQRMFDEGLKKDDPHQYQGVFQIYYYRFEQYRASFTKTSESHAAWMAFQVRRFDSYLMALRARGVVGLWAGASALDHHCIEHAHHVALQQLFHLSPD